MHLELGQVDEGVAELETALALGVEDINAWHTRMDAEKLLAQVRSKRQLGGSPPGCDSRLNCDGPARVRHSASASREGFCAHLV